MENPKCPYCGGEMRYACNGDIVGTHFLVCETCLSRSPAVSFDDDPYAAAMKREKKGEWGKPIWGRDYLDRPIIIGTACSICHKVSEFQTNFCPNCGADIREAQYE